jgi:histidinol-phosphatase (PHP family)
MQRLSSGAVADYHVHPDYSIDAEGSIDDFCRAAIRVGLREICFTTHYDADPARAAREGFMVIDGARQPLSDEGIKHYLDDIQRAYAEYGPAGLMVRGGLEFGYYAGCEEHIADVQRSFPLHYRLGAVHSIDEHCLCCRDEAPKLFAKFALDRLADRYFETLDRAAASGLFDCLAHIDVYRRYGMAHYGEKIKTIHRRRIEKLFATMKKHDVGYEVNTSAIRHGLHEYYPAMEIINAARAAGVRLVALGSDAHRPDQIALDFDTATAVAYELTPYVDE